MNSSRIPCDSNLPTNSLAPITSSRRLKIAFKAGVTIVTFLLSCSPRFLREKGGRGREREGGRGREREGERARWRGNDEEMKAREEDSGVGGRNKRWK
eukprot:615472-Amorphochlora_amoeboformis.AAC.1